MEKLVFCVYDVQADIYDSPMVFDSAKLAIGGIRRNIRDMYIKGEITLDALRDRQLRYVGMFDSGSGSFGYSDEYKEMNIRLSDFVSDLVVSDEV